MTNKKYYPETTNFLDINNVEKSIIKYWQENDIFQKSIDNNDGREEYIFYDGPPFANGLPHYGHLLTGFIKDTFARYHTMHGKKVERLFGWDCHGLPAEMSAEKELNISGRLQIKEFGIDKFNAKCSELVMKYSKEWKEYVTKQARWVDFDNGYKTMDVSFMESVIWAFKELYKKGLVYRDVRIMPYSWACETPLSNFETKLDNSYRQKTSKTVTVKFKLQNHSLIDGDVYCLVWTTTPWTLPANLALAVGNSVEYVIIKHKDGNLICSRSYATKNKYEIIKGITSKNLIGTIYQPLFDYFKNHKGAFTVMSGDFVVDGEGTGIVHIAPGFGEDDFHLCKAHNIKYVCPVNESGCYTDEIYDLKGINVLQANDEVIKKLKNNSNWFATEQYIHNYPHCWRTDEPLIYKAVSSWYIRVTDLKDRMIELNKTVNWYPNHVKEGQFGKWLENVRDWSISRERFWGTPLPIWESDNPSYPRIDVYGSIEELEKDFNTKVDDLHSHHLDKLVRNNPDDPTGQSKMYRVGGVFDCWFESGSMPFAQMHYPFENKEKFEKNSPADFITEYIAQTRGWFYTLFVLSVALFDKIPFKNCVCHGVVLDVKGQKLSKRLNNYEDPLQLFNKYGSDSLRFLMLSSSVVDGGNLLIDKECVAVKDIFRTVLMPIWNAYHFFCMYANADGIGKLELIGLDYFWENKDNRENIEGYELDSFILTQLGNFMNQRLFGKKGIEKLGVPLALNEYNTATACKTIVDFIDDLNNWYIRCNRDRFWSTGMTDSKDRAYRVLYTVLYYFSITIAPLLPIISEYIWQELNFKRVHDVDSIHLVILNNAFWQDYMQKFRNFGEDDGSTTSKGLDGLDFFWNIIASPIKKTKCIVKTGLAIRDKLNIRIRQPLKNITLYHASYAGCNIYKNLLLEQLNIKNIDNKLENIHLVASEKIKVDFKKIAIRHSKYMKKIIPAVKNNECYKFIESMDRHLNKIGDNQMGGTTFTDNEPLSDVSISANKIGDNQEVEITFPDDKSYGDYEEPIHIYQKEILNKDTDIFNKDIDPHTKIITRTFWYHDAGLYIVVDDKSCEEIIIKDRKCNAIYLTEDEYEIIWEPKGENTMIYDNRIAVQLDTTITEELKLEGISRDIIRHIQQKRKDKGLYVQDRINISLYSDDAVYKSVLAIHSNDIKHITLADEIIFTDEKFSDYDDIYDGNLYIKIVVR